MQPPLKAPLVDVPIRPTLARAASLTLLAAVLLMTSSPALAWGPALHAYVNYQARELARIQGVAWSGLDLRAYIAGAPAPDLWYTAEETKLVVPASIEENWEYVRMMFAESKDIKELSFTPGYYAAKSTAAANAKLVLGYDDAEFGANKGQAVLDKALKESASQTTERLFFRPDIKAWIAASGLSAADQQRFYSGTPPAYLPDAGPGDAGSGDAGPGDGAKLVAGGSGCSMGAGQGAGPWALLALLLLARGFRSGRCSA